MNDVRVDSVIADWISEGPDQGSSRGLQRALAATRTVEQRQAWTFPRWWLPKPLAGVQVRVPRLAGIVLLLVLTILALLALAATFVGPEPRIRTLIGPAADTLVAFEDGQSVFVARVDGSARRKISGDLDQARAPVFSPDGTRVAFLDQSPGDSLGTRLLIARVDGSGSPIDVAPGIQVPSTSVTVVAWSPDGERIAFAADDRGVATIFVAASDGSGATAITDPSAHRDLPSWSPDGEWIAYRTTQPDGIRRRLETSRPDGSDVQVVTAVIGADGALSKARWSPTTHSQANFQLSYFLNAGFGSETRAVIDLGFTHTADPLSDGIGELVDFGIPWSPDGRSLAILTANDGVIVADYDATPAGYAGVLRKLGPVADCWLDWSPDGTALYGGSPNGCAQVVVIPLADPAAAITLPMSGVASWQPLPR